MSARSMSGHQLPVRGATDVWLTPPHIVDAVGPFDLDPCAATDQPWPTAQTHLTVEDDGLLHPWQGLVWMNPPFSDQERWFARLAEHGNGIGLCAARTETRWFVAQVWEKADAILFLYGRPHFHHADGTRGRANSGVPIVLVAYGVEAVQRLAECDLRGRLVRLRSAPSPGAATKDGGK